MITWRDEAYVLSARPHGETALILQLLTRDHGRHAGLVRGGQSSRQRALFQSGNHLAVEWSARLADYLGSYRCEPKESHAAGILDDRDRLLALSAAAAVAERALPERESHPGCYHAFGVLMDALPGDHWAEVYVRWELGLLAALGFGLDLSRCAGGGPSEDLAYVSPKSGRAVSREAGAPYAERLLPLPGFLVGRGSEGPEAIGQGLALTAHFLERNIFHPQDRALPDPRERLTQLFVKPGFSQAAP